MNRSHYFEVRKFAVVSTGHMTAEDSEKLRNDTANFPGAAMSGLEGECHLVLILGPLDEYLQRLKSYGASATFIAIMQYAAAWGMAGVIWDRDGQIYEGFVKYDW